MWEKASFVSSFKEITITRLHLFSALLTNVMQHGFLCFRAEQMMIVAGDYKVNIFEGTEQYAKPRILVIHPLYNRTTNNADIMLIKVPQNRCRKVTSGLLKFNLLHLSFFKRKTCSRGNCTIFCPAAGSHGSEQIRVAGASSQAGDRCSWRPRVSGVWVGLQ